MSEQYPPPPGWQSRSEGTSGAHDRQALEPSATYRPPPPTTPHSGLPGAAHKPGAIPLRPLTLGDMYDAAFKIIRFNPKATVGSAVLVASVAMAIPVLITAALGLAMDVSMAGDFAADTTSTPDAPASGEDVAGLLAVFGSFLVGSVLQGIGLILVGGMIAHVVAAATVGRKLSLGQAWAATRGQRWRLIGLTLLLGFITFMMLALYGFSWVGVALAADSWELPVIYGLISIPAFLSALIWFWVRFYYLPVPVLMLEDVGILAALGRGYHLTRRAFWRTFGIALLTLVIAQVAGSMLATPVSLLSQGVLLGGVPGEAGLFLLILGQALGSVIAAAFVAPFTTSVATLQYVDLRMRKEAFDVELMQRAGITQS